MLHYIIECSVRVYLSFSIKSITHISWNCTKFNGNGANYCDENLKENNVYIDYSKIFVMTDFV